MWHEHTQKQQEPFRPVPPAPPPSPLTPTFLPQSSQRLFPKCRSEHLTFLPKFSVKITLWFRIKPKLLTLQGSFPHPQDSTLLVFVCTNTHI